MFLTDAAWYMSLAGKTLNELCSSLMHVNCIAMCVCVLSLKNIEVIAMIKTATVKNKNHKKDVHDAGMPSPLDPVITRLLTWLRPALYYSENLPSVCTIVSNWTSAGLLVSRTKEAIHVKIWCRTLIEINQYRTLAANI